jgi:hypothetical protein
MVELVQIRATMLGGPISVDSNSCLTPYFYQTICEVLINGARMARPTRLIYLSEDGQSSFAKVDQRQKCVLDRLRRDPDQAGTFTENLPGNPSSTTDAWQRRIEEWVDSLEI